MCAWIPHQKEFVVADVDKAAAAFNAGAKAFKAAGITFATRPDARRALGYYDAIDFLRVTGEKIGKDGTLNIIRMKYPDGRDYLCTTKDLVTGVPAGTVYFQHCMVVL